MKCYNIQNYIRYKEDLKKSINSIEGKFWDEYTREELIVKFLPLVENLARKFSTSQQASGVMSINDLIQEGSAGLVKAVDRIDWELFEQSDDIEKTMKSFFSKRIKGAIRRGIDINRGSMRIPEHKLNEIRKNFGEDKEAVRKFFNSIFLSVDDAENSNVYDMPEIKPEYNNAMLNKYLLSLLKSHLSYREAEVIRLSYGLDCDKRSATEIAKHLHINGSSSYVRVSQLKRQAIEKLIENVEHSQVIDFL